jgi:hypothetical protein
VVVVEGCVDGGELNSLCRLGCRQGFEASGEVDGHWTISGASIHANYTGQAVACAPERDLNGQLSEGYCAMAAGEAVLDCCELAGGDDCRQGNAADLALTECSVECAERWEPLKQVQPDPVGDKIKCTRDMYRGA